MRRQLTEADSSLFRTLMFVQLMSKFKEMALDLA